MYTIKEKRSMKNVELKKLYQFELEVSFNEQLKNFPTVCKRAFDSVAIHMQNCYRDDLKSFEALADFYPLPAQDKNGNTVYNTKSVIKFTFDEIDGLKRGKQAKSTKEQLKNLDSPQLFFDTLVFAGVPKEAAIATTKARFNLAEFKPSE